MEKDRNRQFRKEETQTATSIQNKNCPHQEMYFKTTRHHFQLWIVIFTLKLEDYGSFGGDKNGIGAISITFLS